MTQPANPMPHTTNTLKKSTEDFESGAYHPNNIDVTEIENLSGPSYQEVAIKVTPSVLHDAYENDTRTRTERMEGHQETDQF